MRIYKALFTQKGKQKQNKYQLIWEITFLTLNSRINLLHQFLHLRLVQHNR